MTRSMLLASVLLLSACAGTSTRDGLVYRDGSWYSPAADGRGDYYTGSDHRHRHHAYDWPWAWSVGFVPYGGYCPAMYRYCTSFWAEPWYAYHVGYYPYGYAWVPRQVPRRQHRASLMERDPFSAEVATNPSSNEAPERTRPRRDGGWEGRRTEGGGRERPRRRPAAGGGSPE